jgi:hypothetical protein
MSPLQRRALPQPHRRKARAPAFALGMLVALAVGFAVLAPGLTTHNPIERGSLPVTNTTQAARHAHGSAGQQFLVDPGSGFAVRAH